MPPSTTKPCLIIHGGAGNITRENLPPEAYARYDATLRRIHRSTTALLAKGVTALDAATDAVTLFEDCPEFNCGKGAVFTRDGTIELEASVMVSRGYRKRACGVVLVNKVKNPIKLAREMLVRGETDGSGGGNGGNGDPSGGSGGAQGHCCLGGKTVEKLAEEWGLDMVDESYYWTRKRWDEHKRGLQTEHAKETVKILESGANVWPYCINPRVTQDLSLLIATAILLAPERRLTVSQIAEWCSKHCTSRYREEWWSVDFWREHVTSGLRSEARYGCDGNIRPNETKFVQTNQVDDLLNIDPYWTIAPDKEANFVLQRDEGWIRKNRSHSYHTSVYRWPVFPESQSGWDGKEYLPQGTVGCVALDQHGTLCVATSTGGLTNKLPYRIGDTPTIGAGFWAEEWDESPLTRQQRQPQLPISLGSFTDGLRNVLGDCLPSLSGYQSIPSYQPYLSEKSEKPEPIRAVAMSGTGNGDSFLRLAAARTAGAIVRFSSHRSLASAVNQIAGPGGELQRSAGDRWGKTGEGEGGIIGIELADGKDEVVFDFNCGGMFRCWIDAQGKERVMVFREEY